MSGRRENGAGSVYFDHKGSKCRDGRYHKNCTGRWSASLSRGTDGTGKRKRIRLNAHTKTELLAKIEQAKRDAETGVQVSGTYTVSQCLDDFLTSGLGDVAPGTIAVQTRMVNLLKPVVGSYKLREFTAMQALDGLSTIAETHATRTVQIAHNTLARAITMAHAHDKVSRNVAKVIKTPPGEKAGQQRRAFSLDEMLAIMKAAQAWSWKNMDAYVALSFATGASPDEIRGLHWAQVDELDSDEPGVDLTRTLRHHGGTKTAARTRGLGLPQFAIDALKRHREAQAGDRVKAGKAWEDNDLVFCTRAGRPLAYANVGRAFRLICKQAGIEDWDKRVPYEMRHTYASLISDSGVAAEEIAKQLGHSGTRVFETVYRHVLKPRRRAGQQMMDTIISQAQAG